MKVLFVGNNYEGLGIEYLSAVLKECGHDVVLAYDPTPSGVNQDSLEKSKILNKLLHWSDIIIEQIIEHDPDLIGFTVLSDDYPWALKMAKAIKKQKDIPIIFGGIHPTSMPEEVLAQECVDYICLGEGEEAFPEFVGVLEKSLEPKGVKNIWYKKADGTLVENDIRPPIADLNKLPFPDKDLYFDVYPAFIRNGYWIVTGRRCLYGCTYCYNNYLKRFYKKGKYYVRRSVDNVIEELEIAVKKYKIKDVFFHDDIFTHDLDWLREFSLKYREKINLPFRCEVHPGIVNNLEETVQLLVDANCTAIGMGVQSVDATIRKNILKRDYSNEDIAKIIKAFKNTHIFADIDIIAGLPTETDRNFLDAARFINEIKPSGVFTPWLRFYPKTEIADIALEKEVISQKLYDASQESKTSARLTDGGSTFRKSGAKITNLMMLAPLMPRSIFYLIERFKVYKIFPSFNLYPFTQIILFVWGRIFCRKKGPLFCSLLERIVYQMYFMPLKIKSRR